LLLVNFAIGFSLYVSILLS